jgi:hypothetical protein
MRDHAGKRQEIASEQGVEIANAGVKPRKRLGAHKHRDGSSAVAADPRPKMKPGQYEAICFDVKKCPSYGGGQKWVLRFRILGGPHDGEEVAMFCNFYLGKLKPACKLYEQWARALGRLPNKGERIAKKHFKNRLFLVAVVYTKSKGSDGALRPDFLQYSKVETIIEPLTGGVQ